MLSLARQIQNAIAVLIGGVEISTTNPMPISDTWRSDLQSDETANDSDKTFTVPADTEWQILWIWVEFTSTGTAGARQLVVQLQDSGSDVIGEVRVGTTQAASLTYNYMIASSLADLTALRDTDWLMTPFPPTTVLEAGDKIRIYDNNAVDAAADDMVIQMGIATRGV